MSSEFLIIVNNPNFAHDPALSLSVVVNFVQKDFLGSLAEFRNQYVTPIENGQHQDASRRDVIIMKRRVKHLLEYGHRRYWFNKWHQDADQK